MNSMFLAIFQAFPAVFLTEFFDNGLSYSF